MLDYTAMGTKQSPTTPCAFLMELTFRLPPEGQLAIEVSKMKGLGGVAEDMGPESRDESRR